MAEDRRAHEGITIEHPNREKTSSKLTRVVVVLLALTSAVLMLIVQLGGWAVAKDMALASFLIIAVYLLLAFTIARWSKGMLPVAAAAGAMVLANALVATQSWSNRHAEGFTIDTMNPGLLAALCALLVPIQLLLIFFALKGFRQNWNVEIERLPDGTTRKARRPL